jgi:hypothetical protein
MFGANGILNRACLSSVTGGTKKKYVYTAIIKKRSEERTLGGNMKTRWLILALIGCLICSPLGSIAQDSDFHTATIVSVEKLSATPTGTHRTDAPLASNVTEYNLGIQLNGRVYTCRAKTHGDLPTLTQGKEIQAKVDGKVMSAKMAQGQIERFSIIASKNEN